MVFICIIFFVIIIAGLTIMFDFVISDKNNDANDEDKKEK